MGRVTQAGGLLAAVQPALPHGSCLAAYGQSFYEGMSYQHSVQDVITCCPDKLPNYEEKIKSFYEASWGLPLPLLRLLPLLGMQWPA